MTVHRRSEPARRTRNRRSARKAGAGFERLIADHLARHVDDRIDRRVKTGVKDRGDIAAFRVGGYRLVGECKDCATTSLGTWASEAEIERLNDDALAAMIFHKRRGRGGAGAQWVTMTVDDLIAIITGKRPEEGL